jgi:anaerobic magnesium-protoporphyrin IX monomethyl ester cyclase
MSIDCVLIHPGAQHGIYGPLAANLTAIEPPTWCRMIAGWLRDRGISVAIIDQEAERHNASQVGFKACHMGVKLIVIVVSGHQPSASTQQMTAAGQIAEAIKTFDPWHKILMCGNHPSALPVRTLLEESIDYVADGEGPITILGLLKDFPLAQIPGLVWREDFLDENWLLNGDKTEGVIHFNPLAPLIPIDELHGDAWDLLPMERYRAHQWQCFGDLSQRQPYASIYTTLGCPHSCHFCMINVFQHTNAYRRRTPSKVVDEIEFLYLTYGVKTFKFADEMFVLHRQHVIDICSGLIIRGLGSKINIWAYARIDSIMEDLLPMMRDAGIRWLALGIESADESVRDGSQKHMNSNSIAQTVRMIQNAGIHVIGNFIFGLPGDTPVTCQATLHLAKSLNLDFANFYSAMAYPGSPLYDDAVKNGWELPKTWRGYSQHNDECTPLPTEAMTSKEIVAFRDAAFMEFFQDPAYLNRMEEKFGIETRKHIEGMMEYKLVRR